MKSPYTIALARSLIGRGERGGFTLVELVVSMAILGFAMAGTYRVVTMATQVRKEAHHHYVAAVIGNNRIERAKNLTFDSLSLLAEADQSVNALGAPDVEGGYLRTTEVVTSWGGDPQVTRIAVTVRTPRVLRPKESGRFPVTVTTLLTEYEEP